MRYYTLIPVFDEGDNDARERFQIVGILAPHAELAEFAKISDFQRLFAILLTPSLMRVTLKLINSPSFKWVNFK